MGWGLEDGVLRTRPLCNGHQDPLGESLSPITSLHLPLLALGGNEPLRSKLTALGPMGEGGPGLLRSCRWGAQERTQPQSRGGGLRKP